MMANEKSTKQTTLLSGVAEIAAVGKEFPLWLTLALADIRLRYRRTTLGPLWITLSMAVTVLSVGVLYSTIFGNEISHFLPRFATGLVVWTLISSSIIEGCLVFIQAGSIIRSLPVPLVVHIYRMMVRNLIFFAHNAVLVLILWIIFEWPVGWHAVLAILGLAIDVVALFGMAFTVGILSTRFRDVQQIVVAILQLMFLMTPIVWLPETILNTRMSYIVELNPFYYMIEVIRQPIFGIAPSSTIWLSAMAVASVSICVGGWLYARFRHRIAFWL